MALKLPLVLAGLVLLSEWSLQSQQKQPETQTAHWSPAELWRGIDVESLPLDEQVLSSWEEGGGSYRKFTYVSEIANGTSIRVFAIQGIPKQSKRAPGILHIHGGGQTASQAWVQYWVKRGYACMTYDFCGPWEKRAEYTDWGPLARYCNMASNGVYEVHPTPWMSGWFHWALAGRRALTLLSRNPAVDPNKLGIFGISMGGTLCWLVAGSDARVKTAIPIYGCGYNVDRRKIPYGIVPSEDQLIYQEALSPEAHAPLIRCPVLFLSASNDHHGWIDDSFDALGAVQGLTRQAFTPRYIHHIDPEQGADLGPWMDWHLKQGKAFPASPEMKLNLDDEGILRATVQPDEKKNVEKVAIYYALGMKIPPSRFWRRADTIKKSANNWSAALPIMSAWDRVAVFGNVFYSSGICLSTKLAHVMPGQLGKAKPTLAPSLLIDDCHDGGENWFFGPAYTDPNIDKALLTSGEDEGRHYVSVNKALFGRTINFTIASHIFGDPQFRGPAAASLAFDCKGSFNTNGLTITFSEGEWMPGALNYKAPVSPMSDGWKTVTVSLQQFTNEKGASPSSWSKVDRLQFSGVTAPEPPMFSNFRWELPKSE